MNKSTASHVIANPLGWVVGAWALGFLTGLLLPTSELERRSLGPVRDDLLERARSAELLERGKRVLYESIFP